MKRLIVLIALAVMMLASTVIGQQIVPTDSATVGCTAPTTLSDGVTPISGEISYEWFTKDSNGVLLQYGVTTSCSNVVKFIAEGLYDVGVRTVRLINGVSTFSNILWSSDPANPNSGFLVQHYLPTSDPTAMVKE